MGYSIRVLVPGEGEHMEALVHHVSALLDLGRHVLFITADRPFAVLKERFDEAGIDPSRYHCLDLVSQLDGSAPAARSENVHYIASPTMLEMVAMRIEQLAGRLGKDVHVVLDSLNTLALYNGVSPVQEFAHYLANRLRTHGLPADYVIRGNQEGQQLMEMVAGFTDDVLGAGPDPGSDPGSDGGDGRKVRSG